MDEAPPEEPTGGKPRRLDWRMLAPLVVILAIVAVTGIVVGSSGSNSKQPLPNNVKQTKKPQFQGATADPALPAPPLALDNYKGQPIDLQAYRGKAVLVTFLYANCPTLCPVIAGNLHTAESLMTANERSHVQLVAVSVDPKGDTPANVARFLHDHRLTGQMQYLIGNVHQLARVWKAWNVGSERDAQHPDEVNHSGLVYGISGSGKLTTLYPGNFTPAMIVHDIPGLLQPDMSRLRVSPRRALVAGLLVAAIAVGAVFGLRSKSSAPRPAPALPQSVVLGTPVTLHQLKGKPAFVVFWASWCGPCGNEAPAVESFARRVAGRAHVIGVDWDDTDGGARKFAQRHGWTFTSLSDPQGVVGARYGLTVLPTTFLIDARGRIIDRLVGEQTISSLSDALSRQ